MQIQKSRSPESLSNEALLRNTQSLVAEERKLTTEILWHLHEIQIRRLYAEKGYASLFEYAVQVLGYSEAAAGRRISAMRLLVEVPEIEPALKAGSVSLSTLSTIQSFVQRKEDPVSKAEKRELVFALQGKSRRECEKLLIALDPSAAIPQEKERVVSPTQTEIRFIADDELMEKLQKIRELDGHVTAGASYLELFHRMADLALKKLDPLASKKPHAQKVTPPAELKDDASSSSRSEQFEHDSRQHNTTHISTLTRSQQRSISSTLRRDVWRRDQGLCTYRSLDGKRCTSRFALEIDHIQPVALGGATKFENLRLHCRAHNQHQAVIKLGPDLMRAFIR